MFGNSGEESNGYSLLQGSPKKFDFALGMFFVSFIGGFVAWALVEYAHIVSDDIDTHAERVYLVRGIGSDARPEALAVPGSVNAVTAFGEGTVIYTNDVLGISFGYPQAYTDLGRGNGEESVVLQDLSGNHVIAVVRHSVEQDVSIDEFVTDHTKQKEEGCVDVIDCFVANDSELVTVGNRPTIVHTPTNYTAYIRNTNEVYEVLVTSSLADLKKVLGSISFLGE